MNAEKKRTVVITGGANGIGRGIAAVFGEKGMNVVIGDLDDQAGEHTAQQVREKGAKALFVPTDVCLAEEADRLVELAQGEFGSVDVLISNAGIFPQELIKDMSEAAWQKVIDVNLKGLFLMTRAAIKPMMEQNWGRIIATSSITGNLTGYPGWAHYGATKAGINGFIRSAAIELAPHNITVNCVEPGNIMTEGMSDMEEDYISETERSIPMGQLGTPDDVAGAMAYLASDEARYITGQSIVVDGGQTLPESGLAVRPQAASVG
jgi:3-oxoacyl-[acyl-carrier protein] reductase